MKLIRIDNERRLYVHGGDKYVSCLGFDVAERYVREVWRWVDKARLMSLADVDLGTAEHWQQYCDAMAAGVEHHAQTRKMCPSNLSPQLMGLEHKRVDVVGLDMRPRSFIVGKSGGWMPCHLELARSTSRGGGSADRQYLSVRAR